jgi:Cu(I)/Ag(I) efflux system membrane fusion protein
VVAPKNQSGVLAIPTSAVLETGKRKITYRQKADGTYELVELQLGLLAQAHDDQGNLKHYFPVLKGLEEKDRVVVRGGFLLDSQQQINGMPSLFHGQVQSMKLGQQGREMSPTTPFKPGEHKH